MDFTLTADQAALSDALDKLAAPFESKPTDFHGFALHGKDLERELENGQYFELAAVPELGPLSAAMAVERFARLPCTAEIALSMLVRPQLDIGLPRPFAVIENGRPGRFVDGASTLIVIDGEALGILQPAADSVEPVESPYSVKHNLTSFSLLCVMAFSTRCATPDHLQRLIPRTVPSGRPVLVFEQP